MAKRPEGYTLAKAYVNKVQMTPKRGIEFLLTLDQFTELYNQTTCKITGVKMEHRSEDHNKSLPNTFTIDRVDSSKGYEIGNCMAVTYVVNNVKERLDHFMVSTGISDEAKLKLLYQAEYILRKRIKNKTKKVESEKMKDWNSRYGSTPLSSKVPTGNVKSLAKN